MHPGMCNDWLLLICNMNINTIQESMYKIFHVKCVRMTSRTKSWHVILAVQGVLVQYIGSYIDCPSGCSKEQ